MMKECMVRLIYCEMLGYDASFGYIHAIKLAQQGNLLEKRVGMYVFKTFMLSCCPWSSNYYAKWMMAGI